MAYTPTTWANGDTITAAGLNKMEQGIAAAGGVVVLHVDENTGALDKTWNEIYTLTGAGVPMCIVRANIDYATQYILALLQTVFDDEGQYVVAFGEFYAIAATANDYPILQ